LSLLFPPPFLSSSLYLPPLPIMPSSCREVALSLSDCMSKTPCMQSGKSIKECLKEGGEDGECQVLRNAYFECKRSQLDMRKRIRGTRVY